MCGVAAFGAENHLFVVAAKRLRRVACTAEPVFAGTEHGRTYPLHLWRADDEKAHKAAKSFGQADPRSVHGVTLEPVVSATRAYISSKLSP